MKTFLLLAGLKSLVKPAREGSEDCPYRSRAFCNRACGETGNLTVEGHELLTVGVMGTVAKSVLDASQCGGQSFAVTYDFVLAGKAI